MNGSSPTRDNIIKPMARHGDEIDAVYRELRAAV